MRVDARTGDDVTFVCDECGRVAILSLGDLGDHPYEVLIRGDEWVDHYGSTVDGLSLTVGIEPPPAES